jgi:protein kinase
MKKLEFKIINFISSGSYGKVYKVQNLSNKKIYAIKILKEFLQSGTLKDIMMYKELTHKNIIKIYNLGYLYNINYDIELKENTNIDFYIEPLAYYDKINFNLVILMEYCDKNMYEAIPKIRTNHKLLFNYISQIIEGIKYLNSKGYIHGDLKPQNIVIKGDKIKLIDFGLLHSKYHDYDYDLGTTEYIKPIELFCSNNDSPALSNVFAIDSWSLACTIYELYTYSHLFWTADTNDDTEVKIIQTLGAPSYNLFNSLNLNQLIKKKKRYTYNYFTKFLKKNNVLKESKKTIPKEIHKLIKKLLNYHPHKRLKCYQIEFDDNKIFYNKNNINKSNFLSIISGSKSKTEIKLSKKNAIFWKFFYNNNKNYKNINTQLHVFFKSIFLKDVFLENENNIINFCSIFKIITCIFDRNYTFDTVLFKNIDNDMSKKIIANDYSIMYKLDYKLDYKTPLELIKELSLDNIYSPYLVYLLLIISFNPNTLKLNIERLTLAFFIIINKYLKKSLRIKNIKINISKISKNEIEIMTTVLHILKIHNMIFNKYYKTLFELIVSLNNIYKQSNINKFMDFLLYAYNNITEKY